MLVVDASCLYELLTDGLCARRVRAVIEGIDDLAAPGIIDVECMGLIRRDVFRGELTEQRGVLALEDLDLWPGERFPHPGFNSRVWELRDNVRTWDAYYVALAEALDAPLVTMDGRLAGATGPRCPFIVP